MINLLDVAYKLANKKELSIEEKRINEKATKNFQQNGISTQGTYNFNMRSMIEIPQGVQVSSIKTKEQVSQIWDNVTLYENLPCSTKIPYINKANVQFKEYGQAPTEKAQLSSKKFTPHRVVTIFDIPTSALKMSNKDLSKEITENLINAIHNKIIEVMFSATAKSSNNPKGLLNGVEKEEIKTYKDFLKCIQSAEELSNNMTLLLSPSAKNQLFNLSERFVINNDSFNGIPAMTDNRVVKDTLILCDLRNIIITLFGDACLSVDSVTKAKDNITTIIVEVYADWDIMPDSFLAANLSQE